jgi:SPP1 gp7 family putative phage head morphogenesis protein
MFDVEEERKKAELYALQTSSGMVTVNEIRKEMGKDPVEWGDEAPSKWGLSQQSNNFNMGNSNTDEPKYDQEKKSALDDGIKVEREHVETVEFIREYFEKNDKMPTSEEIYEHIAKDHLKEDPNYYDKLKIMEGKDSGDIEPVKRQHGQIYSEDFEGKPGMGHSDKWWEMYEALIREGHSKESAAKITNSKISEKAVDMTQEINRPTSDDFNITEKELRNFLISQIKEKEKIIKQMLEKEAGRPTLQEVKAFSDIFNAIKGILTFEGIKSFAYSLIRKNFLEGWEKAEKQINKNFIPNEKAIEFIQNYTFNNIKGMTEEIANDLRQELERGIMSGEGITKLKKRVSSVFDKGEVRSEMIARTEMNRAENQGKLLAFKESGQDYKKKVIAHIDNRTSDICMRMNGQTVGLNKNFRDAQSGMEAPCPPFHVNCRSTFVLIPKE